MSSGLPTIIHENVPFSCFAGFVKGTIDASINDQGTNELPSVINVQANLGGGKNPFYVKKGFS